jgi:hypothetical protein
MVEDSGNSLSSVPRSGTGWFAATREDCLQVPTCLQVPSRDAFTTLPGDIEVDFATLPGDIEVDFATWFKVRLGVAVVEVAA